MEGCGEGWGWEEEGGGHFFGGVRSELGVRRRAGLNGWADGGVEWSARAGGRGRGEWLAHREGWCVTKKRGEGKEEE